MPEHLSQPLSFPFRLTIPANTPKSKPKKKSYDVSKEAVLTRGYIYYPPGPEGTVDVWFMLNDAQMWPTRLEDADSLYFENVPLDIPLKIKVRPGDRLQMAGSNADTLFEHTIGALLLEEV